MTMQEQPAGSARPPTNYPKQAVVVIHGMGEQIPMDTIRGFVRAVWETDDEVTQNGMPQPKEVWSKPDLRTGSLELRRITTRNSVGTATFPMDPNVEGSGGVRTDFYELYWADLSAGSTFAQVENWVVGLLWRNPFTHVPPALRCAWLFLWIVSIAIIYLLLAAVLPSSAHIGALYPFDWMTGWQPWIPVAIGAFLSWLASRYLVPNFGRVVRYTRARPENIAARKDIRERGLALFQALHEAEYERIVVVGHSLGSILGYDLITYFWATRLASHTVREGDAEFGPFRDVEAAVAAYAESATDANLDKFRKAQRAFCRVLRKRPKPVLPSRDEKGEIKPIDEQVDRRWLITDFVTMGSPLAHADFLLASDASSFRQRIETRDYPVAPPIREVLDKKYIEPAKAAGLPLSPAAQPQLLSFRFPPANWQMHHACPFAAVRWTNIYDPSRFMFYGDPVSGPLAPLFGNAIIDVNLAEGPGKKRRKPRWLSHTKYWKLYDTKTLAPAHVVELRRALNLAGQVEDV